MNLTTTGMEQINVNQTISRANTYRYIAGLFNDAGLHKCASSNYHKAAEEYQAAGMEDEAYKCRINWLYSEIKK